MIVCLAVLAILFTEAGIALTHVWGREDHTHFSHRPWISGLAVGNWFHVASFFSHWPIVILVCWTYLSRWESFVLAVCCSAIWQGVKMASGKSWPSLGVQLYRWITR